MEGGREGGGEREREQRERESRAERERPSMYIIHMYDIVLSMALWLAINLYILYLISYMYYQR